MLPLYMFVRLLCCFFAFIVLCLSVIPVEAVVFADDYFYVYENGERIDDRSVLIFSHSDGNEVFEDVYNGSVFVKSQTMITNLTFYKINNTDIIDYLSWQETQNNGTYSQYVDIYIQGFINNSFYNATVEVPSPDDEEIYNTPVIGTGGIVGSYRYFEVDIETGSIDLIGTKTPETPGFETALLFCIIGITILFSILKKKKRH